MQNLRKNKGWILLVTMFIVVSLACQVPFGNGQDDGGADLQATISVLETRLAESGNQNVENTAEAHSGPTQQVVTEQPTVQATMQSPAGDLSDEYQGFVVYQNGEFVGYDFSGNSTGFRAPAGDASWYGEADVSMNQAALYYSQYGEVSGVYRVTQAGKDQLDFIDVTEPVSVKVNQEDTKIAWSTNIWSETAPISDIFIADIDGSNMQQIDQITAGEQVENWRVFYPVRWLEDGRLLYGTGLTGIGGYLLFWGYNGMYVYNPADASITTLVSDNERLGLCLSSISNDLSMAAITCDDGSAAVRVRNLNNGQEVVFPALPDQVVAGSARFSPSGDRLAYVIQRREPDNERGQVVVVPTDGSQDPQSIASFEGGIYTVEGWYNEDYFLVSRSDFDSNTSLWRMKWDGSDISQLANGNFVSFMP